MASVTYYLYTGAPNTYPNFSTWAGIRNDFNANDRMGEGVATLGNGVFTIEVDGNVSGGNANFLGSLSTFTSGGSFVVKQRSDGFAASTTNALAYDTGFDSVVLGSGESFYCDYNCPITISGLLWDTQDGYIWLKQTASGLVIKLENGLIQRGPNVSGEVVRVEGSIQVRNFVVLNKSTSAGAVALGINLRHSASPTVEQCVFITQSTATNGISDPDATGATLTNFRNNFVGGATTPYGGLSAGSATGNASSTTGTPGTNTIDSVAVSTTNFESVTGNGNWKVKTASVLCSTGAARLSTATTDAYGQSRETTTTIGAFKAETSGAFTITADQGSYALTGQAAGVFFGRAVAAAQGSYALTGQDVTFTYVPAQAFTMPADQGSYTLTGQDVALTKETPGQYVMPADYGSYILTGSDALADYAMNIGQGAYALNGQDVSFSRTYPQAYSISADQGLYSLTGRSVRLVWSGEPIVPNRGTGLNMGMKIGL